MNKILFVPANSREIDQFNMVRRELNGRGCNILAIALDKNMENLLQGKRFSYRRITDYKTRNMLTVIKREKPDIIVTDFCGRIPRALIFAANYMDMPSLQIDDGITADYSAFTNISFRQLFLTAMIWFKKGIEGGNSWPLSSLFITLMSINSPLRFLKKMSNEILKFTSTIPDYNIEGLNIAVMGRFAKDAYISMRFPAKRIFVTGQPRFDTVWQKKYDRNQVMRELSIQENKSVIVLATEHLVGFIWTKEDREKFIETVCSAMREFPDKQLVIKLHPVENMEVYKEILANIGEDKAIICQDIDIYELLDACDLLMTVHSTVGLEAMIFDKPVITIDLTGTPELIPYAKSGAAIGVYKEEDLAPAIRDALYDEEIRKNLAEARKKFVYEHAYKLDGQASKRAADLIIQLVEESKRKKNET